MTFVLLKNYDYYVIVNDDCDYVVGCVHPLNGREGPYQISGEVGPWDGVPDAGVVSELSDAVPTFLAYYEKNPPLWGRVCGWYGKDTLYGYLRVKQHQQGYWSAYRDGYPLLRRGKPACFATHTDAQRAADTHELDLYPNAPVIDDGFSWERDPEFDWRSIPDRVGKRAWQRGACGFERC